MEIRKPEPRRRTIYALPELQPYIGKDEKPIKSHPIGLSAASKHLLTELSIQDDMAESTWLSYLAHKLHTKQKLLSNINRFANREYGEIPGSFAIAVGQYTIPDKLWDIIQNAAKLGPFADRRGVTSTWLRAAIYYFAFEKRKWPLSCVPADLWKFD